MISANGISLAGIQVLEKQTIDSKSNARNLEESKGTATAPYVFQSDVSEASAMSL